MQLPHFAITIGTPASLHNKVAIILASKELAIAITTTSIFAIPSCSITAESVISAHLHTGKPRLASSTISSSLSTAITSAP